MTDPEEGVKLDDRITIRRARTVADYRACQEAQRQAWGISEEGYVVPVATMVGANLHGGMVLGAFLPDGQAVAMSFAFLGRIEGRLCLYSQLTGVVPGYQSHGLGYQIKLLQRELARADGIAEIAWAFDPLQAGNAHFNLARLGATSGRYVENMYGERTDALNRGVPTDRLIAVWETRPAAALEIPAGAAGSVPRLIDTRFEASAGACGSDDAVRFVGKSALGPPLLLLEIPDDVTRLRRESPALAELWRAAVKQAFRAAFDARYRAASFIRDDSSGHRRDFYVLERLL